MARPVTLFTGQWADLPLDDLAAQGGRLGLRRPRARVLGRPLRGRPRRSPTPATSKAQRELLERHGLGCWALGAHLVGQAVCDPIDERHQGDPPARGLGRRRPGGRAAARGRADEGHRARRRRVRRHAGERLHRLARSGTCSTRSRRTTSPTIERGYERVRRALGADHRRLRRRRASASALEVHPTEIAYDFVTTRKTLDAIGQPRGVRDQLRPEPPRAPVPRLGRLRRGVRRPDLPRARQGLAKARSTGAARSSASHLNFGEAERGWDFVSPGHGDVDFEELFRALNRIGYTGPLSIEWEDSGMDREWGAQDALAFVRRTDFAPSDVAFDAAMQTERGMSDLTTGSARSSARAARLRRDRRRHARVRLHGQGALERASEDPVHDLAAAAAARSSSRSRAATRRRCASAAERYGYERWTTDWRELVADPEIELFDNGGPNNAARRADDRRGARRASTSSARSRSGATADESYEIWQRGRRRPASSTCARSTTASCRPSGSRAR